MSSKWREVVVMVMMTVKVPSQGTIGFKFDVLLCKVSIVMIRL